MSRSDEELGLQFPCEFPLKVMGKSNCDLKQTAETIVSEHVLTEHRLSVTERSSSEARFISITVTIEAQSREQLDKLYQAFNAHPDIMMVL